MSCNGVLGCEPWFLNNLGTNDVNYPLSEPMGPNVEWWICYAYDIGVEIFNLWSTIVMWWMAFDDIVTFFSDKWLDENSKIKSESHSFDIFRFQCDEVRCEDKTVESVFLVCFSLCWIVYFRVLFVFFWFRLIVIAWLLRTIEKKIIAYPKFELEIVSGKKLVLIRTIFCFGSIVRCCIFNVFKWVFSPWMKLTKMIQICLHRKSFPGSFNIIFQLATQPAHYLE